MCEWKRTNKLFRLSLHHKNKIPVTNKDINVMQNTTNDYFLEHHGVDNSKYRREIRTISKFLKKLKRRLKV